MENKISKLIKNLEKKFGEDSFEVSNYSLLTALGDKPEVKILYNEGDLTKNFVLFVSDLLAEKYLEVDENTIRLFGETLKSDPKNFKQSYRNKPYSIKKIQEGVYIHTNLSRTLMESLIVDLVRTNGLVIKFYDKLESKENELTPEKIQTLTEEYRNVSELIQKDPESYRQLVRCGLKEKIAENYRNKNKWTVEKIRDVALKYNSIVDFKKLEPSAYIISKRLGIFPSVTEHMTKIKKPK